MKRICVLLLILLPQSFLVAQTSSLIFYTEAGENFTLFVDGDQINDAPAPRVQTPGIAADFVQVRVQFEEAGAPVLTKQLMVEPGMALTAMLKRNKKGKYVFRPVGTAAYTETKAAETVQIPTTGPPTEPDVRQPVVVEETTTATVLAQQPSTSLIDLEVTEGGQVGLKVNLPSQQPSASASTTSTGSTTTGARATLTARVEGNKIQLSDGRSLDWKYTRTKKLTGTEVEMTAPLGAHISIAYNQEVAYESDVPFWYRETDWKRDKDYFKLTVQEQSGLSWSVKLQNSSNNRILIDNLQGAAAVTQPGPAPVQAAPTQTAQGCARMAQADFERATASITAKSFAEEKMTVARQIIRSNCFSVQQVRELMDLFTYEEEKLSVAKLAYAKTVDQNNYYQLNDGLTYSDSVEELNRFLEQQ